MEILKNLAEDLVEAYTPSTVAIFVLIGLFLFFVESRSMAQKKLKSEKLLLKAIGVLYAIGSIVVYLIIS
ncbi:MAG: hypothetical protein PWP45_556 [Tepidanaerobacteraceae bacterium]|nr:hypothetical protein [Tepidanaerobacteraceae bacterium]